MTNKYVHDKLIKKPKIICTIDDVDYYKGLEIICKKYLKTTKMKLYVNYSYIIKSVNSDCAVIHEPVENVDISIGTDILQKHFRLAYANTCHSVQGLTIEDEFTIFDCDTAYVNRNWVWTALTRTDDLNKITIFEFKFPATYRIVVLNLFLVGGTLGFKIKFAAHLELEKDKNNIHNS